MIYQNVVVSWKDVNSTTIYRATKCTKEEAIKAARFFGYKPPKWYEFWKKPARVIAN